MNEIYKDVSTEPIYWVDYIWSTNEIDESIILGLADLNIYGQGIQESLIGLKDISLSPNNVTLMSRDKNPTLKIQVGSLALIKFKSSEEEYEKFTQPNMILTCVIKPQKNEWNGTISPQGIIEEFELREEWKF
jgi:single-stranded DNA-specific DHH superfamily exonuclease